MTDFEKEYRELLSSEKRSIPDRLEWDSFFENHLSEQSNQTKRKRRGLFIVLFVFGSLIGLLAGVFFVYQGSYQTPRIESPEGDTPVSRPPGEQSAHGESPRDTTDQNTIFEHEGEEATSMMSAELISQESQSKGGSSNRHVLSQANHSKPSAPVEFTQSREQLKFPYKGMSALLINSKSSSIPLRLKFPDDSLNSDSEVRGSQNGWYLLGQVGLGTSLDFRTSSMDSELHRHSTLSSNFNLGVERRLTNHWSLELDLGVRVSQSVIDYRIAYQESVHQSNVLVARYHVGGQVVSRYADTTITVDVQERGRCVQRLTEGTASTFVTYTHPFYSNSVSWSSGLMFSKTFSNTVVYESANNPLTYFSSESQYGVYYGLRCRYNFRLTEKLEATTSLFWMKRLNAGALQSGDWLTLSVGVRIF